MKFLINKVAFVLLPAILLLCTSMAFGLDDWPFWRGPNRNDQSSETGLLKSWPEGGPKKAWINKDAGLGYAGFAVVGEHLFTLGLEGEKEFAICLNVKDGSEVWRQDIGPIFVNGWGDGPRSTPTVDADSIYALGANGDLVCLSKSDGAKKWSVQLQDFGSQTPKWGYAESPLVDEGKVICTTGGKIGTILALDKKTGKKIWQSKPITKKLEDGTDSNPAYAHYSSIVPVNLNNRRQYVQLTPIAVVAVDADNGELIWQSEWRGRTAVIPSPIVVKDKVYVTSGYNAGAKLIQIGEDDVVTDLWHTKDMQNHHGGVIKIGDYFYGSSAKAWVCQKESDGQMAWADRRIGKGCLTYADGLFYHVEERTGRVLLIKADPESHTIISQFKMEPQTERRKFRGKIWVHPVIANGKLYVRDQEIIICYDIKAE